MTVRRLLMAYALLGPTFVFRPTPTASFGATDLLFIPALLAVLLVRSPQTPKVASVYGLFVAVATYTAFAAFFQDAGFGTLFAAFRLFAIFLPFVLVFRLSEFDEQSFARIVGAVFFGGFGAVVLAIGMHYLGIEVRAEQQRLWLGDGQGSVARASGLLGNTGGFGHLTSVWALNAVLLAPLVLTRARAMAVIAVAAPLSAWALMLSVSRGGLVHLIAGLVIALPLLFNTERAVRIVLPMGLLAGSVFTSSVVAGSSLPISSSFLVRSWTRLDFLNLSGESEFFTSVRFANWSNIVASIDDNPVLGVGLKQFSVESGLFIDNSFLSTSVETGLIGGALYLTFWLALGARFARRAWHGSKLGQAGLALVVSEMLHAATLDTYSLWYSMPTAFLLIALCIKFDRSSQPGTFDTEIDLREQKVESSQRLPVGVS